jgi:hypothetical protein
MSGRPGKGGGWNRLSDEEHARRGTKPRGRRRPGLVPVPNPNGMPPDLLDGVTGRGTGFVEECYASYRGWTIASLMLLRECGLLIDQLEAARGQPAELGLRRALLAVLAALDLREELAIPVSAPSKWAGELA